MAGAGMATVRHVCGGCGADVQWREAVCRSCGMRLVWGEGHAGGSGHPAAKPVGKQHGALRRRPEPWQVISFIAVGALLVFLVWSELSRERALPAAPAGAAVVPQQMPVTSPAVDLGPLETAVAANPSDADAALRLANGLHDGGMLPRAIQQYKKYLSLRPDDPDARVDLGICYDQMGLVDSLQADAYYALAVKEMEAAFKGNPSHQPAAFNLGIVNLHMGNLEESNAWLKKAAAINKDSDLGKRALQILQQHSVIP